MVLFLNDIAGSEVLVILAFILIFFGSKSIPGIARSMGTTIRQLKDATSDLQNEIKKSGADIKNELNLRSLLNETADDIKAPLDQYVSDLQDAVQYEPSRKHVVNEHFETASEKKSLINNTPEAPEKPTESIEN